MDGQVKARLIEEGGKLASDLLRTLIARPQRATRTEEKTVELPQQPVTSQPSASRIDLPTSEETTVELRRRLAKELYRAELDLAAGMKIAGKPCDCLSNKHTLMLESAAEELISQDPGNAGVYQEIIDWIPRNARKVTPEAIQSGKYTSEYPTMANEFKAFRKRVMGSAAEQADNPTGVLTLEQAKKMAAEEAAKEVERAWKLED